MDKISEETYREYLSKFSQKYARGTKIRFNAERTPSEDRLIYIDGEEVMEMIQNLKYIPMFDAKEKFYKIKEEQIGKYIFGAHMILRDGMVDMVWIVKENDNLLLGEPWSIYSRRIIDRNYRIKKPIFGTYEDLEEIIEITFKMYEDFKRILMDTSDT